MTTTTHKTEKSISLPALADVSSWSAARASLNKAPLVAVILAGGAGTRFWPSSTEARPKQFLTITGERSLLQQSYDRVASLVGPEHVLVLTSSAFADLARTQLPMLDAAQIIAEPLRRDTAAAIALAAVAVEHRYGKNAVMAVVTSDHIIEPTEIFQQSLLSAALGAQNSDALYTFGIPPTYPATGFGYLELGYSLAGLPDHHELKRFVEKPPLDTAIHYLASGQFLWNSGMFVWKTQTILDEYQRLLPKHLEALQPIFAGLSSSQMPTQEALTVAFTDLQKISVDYAIMEKAREVRCLRAPFEWSDVGSFPALADHLPQDDSKNTYRGQVYILDAKNNIVFSEDQSENIALLGVDNLIVVRAGDKTLVMDKAHAEQLKNLVAILPASIR